MKLRIEDFKDQGVAANIKQSHANLVSLMLYLQRRYAVEFADDPDEVGRRVIVVNDIIGKLDEICQIEDRLDVEKPKRPRLHRGKGNATED